MDALELRKAAQDPGHAAGCLPMGMFGVDPSRWDHYRSTSEQGSVYGDIVALWVWQDPDNTNK
jgi:hypothetical protein